MFYNYTNEPFVAKWGGASFTIPAGEYRENMTVSDDKQSSVMVNNVVARIWGHHLAHKVLNSPSLTQNFDRDANGKTDFTKPMYSKQAMVNHPANVDLLIEHAMSLPGKAAELSEQLAELPLLQVDEEKPGEVTEEVVSEPVAKKRSPGRPKKEEASPSPEAEFEV